MAGIFCDGFDHYDDLNQKWSGVVQSYFGVEPTIVPGAGRFASGALRIGSKYQRIQADFGPRETYIVGAAYLVPNSVKSDGQCIFSLWNGSTMELALWVDQTNVLWVYNGTTSWYCSRTIKCDTWEYIELKVTAHPSTGSVYVHLNGVEVLAQTGVKTSSVAYYSGVSMSANYPFSGAGIELYEAFYDDVYICDDASGPGADDFLGDVRVEEQLPNEDGSYQEFNRDVPGSGHYNRINENPPDEDGTYVYSNTLSTIDTYTFPSITPAADAEIYFCVVNFETKKLESGERGLSAFSTYSGASTVGTEERITTAYSIYQSFVHTDPVGASWTKTTVEGSEWGPKITT